MSEACQAIRWMRPEVAIVDINLPDGNGVDLIPILRAEHADLPVILSTGHIELSLSNEKKRILSLMKPYEIGDLLAAIGNVTATGNVGGEDNDCLSSPSMSPSYGLEPPPGDTDSRVIGINS